MDDKKTNDMDIRVNLDAGSNKIKYYETDNSSCVFEIINEDENNNSVNQKGIIEVVSILDYGEQEYIQGVKINLYKINGLTSIPVASGITDEYGKICFDNVEYGNYRVIELVDKRYFEKPRYVKWNEITINSDNVNPKIVILNRLKKRNKTKN